MSAPRLQLKSGLFIVTWLACSAISLLAPLLIFVISRSTNSANKVKDGNAAYNEAQLYATRQKQYAQQQKYQEQQASEYAHDDWWNDDWVYRKKYNDESNNCSFLWGCAYKSNHVSAQAEPDDDYVPVWWIGDRSGEAVVAYEIILTIVYVFVFCMAVGITIQGVMLVLNEPDKIRSLTAILVTSCLFCVMMMTFIIFVPGTIAFEGLDLSENGWYGQVGILLFMTCMFWMVFSASFAVLVRGQTARVSKLCYSPANSDEPISDYEIHDDPAVDTKKIVLKKIPEPQPSICVDDEESIQNYANMDDKVQEEEEPYYEDNYHTISFSPSKNKSRSFPSNRPYSASRKKYFQQNRRPRVNDREYNC